MKTAVISFNSKGDTIARRIGERLEVSIYRKAPETSYDLSSLTEELMKEYEAVIFIASTGIAVRAIAPHIKSKATDPAVLVVDIFGKHVISLLSGHLGGANELTLKVAEILQAVPVITTATDILDITAPDVIAKREGLVIENLKGVKKIAALLIEGKRVAFYDEENKIAAPKGYINDLGASEAVVVVTNKAVSEYEAKGKEVLKLIRKNIVLGIGCRKDYPTEKMKELVLEKLRERNIDYRAVKAVGTVEIKSGEKAIVYLAEFLEAELKIFKLEEIKAVQHKYEGSDFVEKTLGVRAVCEPCAELCGGKVLTEKLALEGMTLCIGGDGWENYML